jgi:hypothetical protein
MKVFLERRTHVKHIDEIVELMLGRFVRIGAHESGDGYRAWLLNPDPISKNRIHAEAVAHDLQEEDPDLAREINKAIKDFKCPNCLKPKRVGIVMNDRYGDDEGHGFSVFCCACARSSVQGAWEYEDAAYWDGIGTRMRKG